MKLTSDLYNPYIQRHVESSTSNADCLIGATTYGDSPYDITQMFFNNQFVGEFKGKITFEEPINKAATPLTTVIFSRPVLATFGILKSDEFREEYAQVKTYTFICMGKRCVIDRKTILVIGDTFLRAKL